jgi:hypothetical protein
MRRRIRALPLQRGRNPVWNGLRLGLGHGLRMPFLKAGLQGGDYFDAPCFPVRYARESCILLMIRLLL